jgi:hypothetical protein
MNFLIKKKMHGHYLNNAHALLEGAYSTCAKVALRAYISCLKQSFSKQALIHYKDCDMRHNSYDMS